MEMVLFGPIEMFKVDVMKILQCTGFDGARRGEKDILQKS